MRAPPIAAILGAAAIGVATVDCGSAGESGPPGEPPLISMLSLIVTPERYDGRWVRVSGYLVFEFEHYYLYLTEEDARFMQQTNGVELDRLEAIPPDVEDACQILSEHNVMLTAAVRLDKRGHAIFDRYRSVAEVQTGSGPETDTAARERQP